MKTNFLLVTMVSVGLLSGCSKKTDLPAAGTPTPTPTPTPTAQTIDNMQVSPDFRFNTDVDVDLQITTLDNADNPVPAIRINIYTDYPDNGGNLVMSCNTGVDGAYTGILKLPAYSDSVVLQTGAIGFVQLQKRKITNNTLHCVYGGKTPAANGFAGIPETNYLVQPPALTGFTAAVPYIKPLSTFNSAGVPSNLTVPNDVVDASFLSDVNAALPEWRPVPNYNPEYLLQNAQTNLVIQQPSQVWVTFFARRCRLPECPLLLQVPGK